MCYYRIDKSASAAEAETKQNLHRRLEMLEVVLKIYLNCMDNIHYVDEMNRDRARLEFL